MRAGFSFSYPSISLLLGQPLSIKKSYAGAIQWDYNFCYRWYIHIIKKKVSTSIGPFLLTPPQDTFYDCLAGQCYIYRCNTLNPNSHLQFYGLFWVRSFSRKSQAGIFWKKSGIFKNARLFFSVGQVLIV
jgi:hypothetical protein